MTEERETPCYLTIAESAKISGFTRGRILNFLESGRLRGTREHGKNWRWLVDEGSLKEQMDKISELPND